MSNHSKETTEEAFRRLGAKLASPNDPIYKTPPTACFINRPRTGAPPPSLDNGKENTATEARSADIAKIRKAEAGTAGECKQPVVLDESDLRELRERGRLPGSPTGDRRIPLIGYGEPEGFERVDITGEDWPEHGKYECDGKGAYFIDISGYGAADEPALTIGELGHVLKPGYGYALIETGEFQGHLGVFREV